jgi:3-methyladenine DNA glycosylase/8-oxoguanine DNA glycosylase
MAARRKQGRSSPAARPSPRRRPTTRPARPRARPAAKSAPPLDPDHAVATLRAADPTLGRAIEVIGAYRLDHSMRTTTSVYAALTRSIVSQQLSGKAAATIYGRVCALFEGGRHGPRPEQILDASDAVLRGAGLSGAKTLALRDLATRSLACEIPTLAEARRLSDEEVIEQLTAVRGVGRWTAEMFLMFRLDRPDILPIDDYGVRKGFALAFGHAELPKPRALALHGERWAPYRSVASWYLWRVADRGGIAPD